MASIDKNDIQGILLKGYSNLPAACFIVLSIQDAYTVKKWLGNSLHNITKSDENPLKQAFNLAFTFEGLKSLGLEANTMDTFPMEFEDGMTTPHKQDYLGDYGASDPAKWEWGGKQNETVHILLLLYADTSQRLEAIYTAHQAGFASHGLIEIKKLETTLLPKRKEHFGFHDGIAQPTIKGLNRADVPENTVATGEFVLGYQNEYNQYPQSPSAAAITDSKDVLHPLEENQNLRNLGKNGSYLVFRQYDQDVLGFWNYMDKATRMGADTCNEQQMIQLAAKMVGRWPGGAPLTLCPEKDVVKADISDHFGYRASDSAGLKCPFASHIRRTNPRDAQDLSEKASVAISNKHRILRRGRSYGVPVVPTMEPEDILKVSKTEGTRGLYFLCFNADIGRQFEFVQNAWLNNPKFNSLYDERDPIAGNHSHPANAKSTGTFSLPKENLRTRLANVPEFVIVKGGAYFFLPAIRAISYLSAI